MNKQRLLALLGVAACLMVLFPPVHTFHSPVLMEDRGIAWQMRGGTPNLVVADTGGFRDKRFAFLLSLDDNDKIRFNQLTVQLVVLAMAGLGAFVWKPWASRPGDASASKTNY
jgi:hypothetical protein